MASKRPVAPETPIRSFPTPNVDDLVVVVDVDSRLPGYKPLEYGTPHPDQTRFAGAKLVYQEPLDGSDQFVRRIYATDRSDQDAYNYAIKYSAGSPGHPIYIRSYVEPRESYVPLPDGSPDSVFPDAFLVEEEMAPVEGELNSLYVRVTRAFETLPGPLLTSFETNDAGQKVTVTTQRKASSGYTLPAASATSSPSAQAEDAGVVTEQVRSVPAVFARRQFSAERPDPLPTKFRAAVPDVETSEIVSGTAQQPTLDVPEDLSASETQESLFLKRVSRRLRPDPDYPVTFTETVRTNTGQLATTVSTLEDTLQTADTGPLVESSEVTDLGDGRSIKVTTEVDQLFARRSFAQERPDVIPVEFRDQVPTSTTELTESGTATPVSLVGDEIAKSQEQLTEYTRRTRTSTRSNSLTTSSLTGRALNSDWGVPEIVTDQLVTPSTLPNSSGLVVADEITPLSSTTSRRVRRVLETLPAPYTTYETVEKNIVVAVKREVLTRNQALPEPVFAANTMDVQDQPLQFPYVLRTTKTLLLDPTTGQPILPQSRIEYDNITFTFPGIIYNWRVYLGADAAGEITVTADLSHFENRFPVTMIVAAKYVTTFHLENDPALNISNLNFWKVITRPWAQVAFGIPDNTIHPPAPVTLRNTPVLRGNLRYTISNGLSSEPQFYSPGDELLISGESKPWFGNVWYRRLLYVKEPTDVL